MDRELEKKIREERKLLDGDEYKFKLYTALKGFRRKIAKEENIPLYMVFKNDTLIDMSKKMPQSKEEMLKIVGVNEDKYEKYGERFLKKIKQTQERLEKEPWRTGKIWNKEEQENLLAEYNSGMSIHEIAEKHQRKAGAIERQLREQGVLLKMDIEELNSEQQKAVLTTKGPLLIIAGPGTGKTKTLVKRVLYLLLEKGVKASEIFIATFTDKAANELKTRISNELLSVSLSEPINMNEMYIGTFHSIFMQILSEYIDKTTLKKNFKQIEDFEQQELINRNFQKFKELPHYSALTDIVWKKKQYNRDLRRYEMKWCSYWEAAGKIANIVNNYREELVDVDKMEKEEDERVKAVAEIMDKYEELLQEENCIDFSGILAESYRLLTKHPEVLKELTEKIKYIMVDEYQDTNYIQEQLVLLLAGNRKNICVVGDDDQGLYRFRGATISNIFNFPNHFQKDECTKIYLKKNYRSAADIIDFYNQWMDDENGDAKEEGFRWGNSRYKKTIECVNENSKGKVSVVKCSGKGEEQWHQNICRFIKELQEKKQVTNLNQIAFLVRNTRKYGKDAYDELIEYLEKNGIPVYAPRFGMYFKRDEIKQMIGCLLLCFPKVMDQLRNDKKYETDKDFKEIVQYYDVCINSIKGICMEKESPLGVWVQKKTKELNLLKGKGSDTFSGMMYQMLEFEPFRNYVTQQTESGVVQERAARNIANLISMISRYEISHNISGGFDSKYLEKNVYNLFAYYLRYRKEGHVNEYEDDSEYAPSGCVSFMTIHQSKGMEFPIVMVDSLHEVPYERKDELTEIVSPFMMKTEIEESENIKYYDYWRLYYTAFSRAENLLVLTCNESEQMRHGERFCLEKSYKKLKEYSEVSLEHIHPKEVKNVDLKETYSFTSHLGVYETCARQYYYYKKLGFTPNNTSNTLFGTLVHETIEDIHKAAINGRTEDITAENIQLWLNLNYETLSKAEHSYLNQGDRKSAYEQVMRYVAHNGTDWSKIRETEVEVCSVKENYILLGKVDLVQGVGDTYELIDFKTGEKPNPETKSEQLKHYEEQLTTYAHIIEEKTGKKISRTHLYYTSVTDGDPMISFDITEDKINDTLDRFDDIVKKIQCNDFTGMATEKQACQMCDMRYYCHEDFSSPASQINFHGVKDQEYVYGDKGSYSKYYHTDRECVYLSRSKEENIFTFSREEAQKQGYVLCLACKKRKER